MRPRIVVFILFILLSQCVVSAEDRLLTGLQTRALHVAFVRFSQSRYAKDLPLYNVSVGQTKSGFLVTFVPPPAKMTTQSGSNGFETVTLTSTSARFIKYWVSKKEWRVTKEQVDKD